jgi:DNA-binding NarL/FixJ family response regulator
MGESERLRASIHTFDYIRIMLGLDHPLLQQGLALLLDSQADMTVVAQANNGKEAVALFQKHQPDVTLLELRMPCNNGQEAIAAIRAEVPDARIILLTTYDGSEDIYQGLRTGAMAYLLKDTPCDQLLESIRRVYAGYKYIPASVGALLQERLLEPQLSDREREVLRLMAAGKINQEIGAALGIKESTVKFHVNNILSKLQVNDRTSAVVMALRRGIAHLESGDLKYGSRT